jgi:hypothetical protein
MLADRLKSAFEQAQKLPPEAQDRIAEEIERAIDNAQWDAELNDPQYDEVLRELIEEAKREPSLPFPTPSDIGDQE